MEVGSDSDSDFYGPVGTVYKLTRRARTGEKPANPVVVEVKGNDEDGDIEEVKDEEPTEEMLTRQLLRMIPPAPAPSSIAQPDPQRRINDSRHQFDDPRLGVSYECQPGEDIGMFLRRLPPATTMKDERTPWIYVRNPLVGRPRRLGTGSQLVLGCEDEGPEAEGSHILLFVAAARERLDLLRSFLDGIPRMGAPGTAARDMDAARQSAARDIVGLAGRLGVTCGKWMLFVQPKRVNRSWEAVARATHRGDLGVAAKVAPRDPELALSAADEAKTVRPVCVYTSDFRNIDDITRVLRRLEVMRLVTRGRGRIYYKCDAYTYLGIGANNPWGLRASMFSSDDVFGRLDAMLG